MNQRALVVEDDRSWQQILSEILTDAGLTVDVTDSYATAVAAMRTVSHRLAVVDLSLGGSDHHNQDGLQVLDAVKRHDPGCVPVLLTGFATVEIAVSAMREYGAYSCLRKEMFRRSQFRELVREVLADAPSFVPGSHGGDSRWAGSEKDGQAVVVDADARTVVLVVEDDAGWRDIFQELLGDGGHEVRICRSYGEALGHLKRLDFDLAVVDLSLASSVNPDDNVDGLRLLDACQKAGLPAIVVSGIASPTDMDRIFQEHDAHAFLEKQSFDRAVFRQTVAEALAISAMQDPLNHLTEREREVLDCLVQGMTNKQIAEALIISPNTVKRHLKAIFAKLEVNTRAAAVAKAMGEG